MFPYVKHSHVYHLKMITNLPAIWNTKNFLNSWGYAKLLSRISCFYRLL